MLSKRICRLPEAVLSYQSGEVMSTIESSSKPRAGVAFALSRRSGNILGLAACVVMLAFAYFLQFAKGIEPCPLCILQRLAVAAVGLGFLIAAVHHPLHRWAAYLYGGVIAVIALAGESVAIRHVWIQHTPESMRPACGPGIEFLLNTFGPVESLRRILHGSGECGSIDWTFLNLSIPEWNLITFVVLAGYALFVASRS
jgi:disulfide bond formation protein DsbB